MVETTSNNSGAKLAGKVAIVTGGSGGIGEAAAHAFADQGARVVIADVQDDLGNKVAESIGTNKCTYIHCNVADEEQVQNLIQSTVNTFGQIDIMFSNAGISSELEQTIIELDISELNRLLAVNASGMAACVKHAARAMVDKHVRGSIVCTGSIYGSNGGSDGTDYAMSKHALLGLVRSASIQLAEHGIRVNCVSPNALVTPMTLKYSGSEEKVYELCAKTARLKGVILTAKHIADAVLFLASNDSEFITGHDLVVDGSYIAP
ncbi:hypothetical protein TanjilG_00579 [Lupinus angustifolius]|uniref:Uncharacterized protein n=1 Tax=Lupinus angustifolius TaxID=3871 RepID=A0A394D9A0_LUPAN|nr:PREDICTED: (-)-isopiperitenol/(-)-carveol dehydrogenase, mitochondrial-like [Lupinus angustifolius]OIW20088.1 hypothetical protein TanjilG_00579 [Lupinus angustifolius]